MIQRFSIPVNEKNAFSCKRMLFTLLFPFHRGRQHRPVQMPRSGNPDTALRQAALYILQSQTADQDEEEACDKGNDDLGDHDVKISFPVGHFADAQQSDLRALMRQGIQCARSDGSDSVDLFQVGTEFNISIFEGVKRNAHTAGSGSAGAGTDCNRDHYEKQR